MGNAVLELIREVGLHRLGGFDGCMCTHFSVQRVDVDVSCRKSSGGTKGFYGTTVRVHSRSLDQDGAELEQVAREVAKQIHEQDGCELRVRYCDYLEDRDQKCVHCAKPREDAPGYLCDACLTQNKPGTYAGQTVADERDYRKHEFIIPSRWADT